MIKRNDLAKQFEIVVQQEIINHNKQISESNLSINKMLDNIVELSEKIDKLTSKHDSRICTLEIHREMQTNILDDIYNKIDSTKVDFIKNFNENILKIKNLEITVKNITEVSSQINVNLFKLSSECLSLSNRLRVIQQEGIEKYNNLFNEFRDLLGFTIQEINDKPSEAQAVKKELLEKISIDRVDFEGVMRELQILKKDNLIKEKNIEKLYILIERLEKRIEK
jgi:hypothetical protein